MATSKIPKVKDLSGYFFMSIEGNTVDIIYHDNTDNGLAIGAAFASALEKDKQLFKVLSAAMITVLNEKEKDSSKKKPNPKQMNGVKSDAPFVKTRKKKSNT
jgi:hypothetical protein